MIIKEAIDTGLLKKGMLIKTNGSFGTANTKYVHAQIVGIGAEDIFLASNEFGGVWLISKNNILGTVEILSPIFPFYGYCRKCLRILVPDGIKDENEGYCDKCLRYVRRCAVCNALHLMNEMNRMNDGTFVCFRDFNSLYFTCSHCNSVESLGNMCMAGNGIRLCRKCLEAHCGRCNDCQGMHLNYSLSFIRNKLLCPTCRNKIKIYIKSKKSGFREVSKTSKIIMGDEKHGK